jgi:hypothetical protein
MLSKYFDSLIFYQYFIILLAIQIFFNFKFYAKKDYKLLIFWILVIMFELLVNKIFIQLYKNSIFSNNVYISLTTTFYIYFLIKDIWYQKKESKAFILAISWLFLTFLFTFLCIDMKSSISPTYNLSMFGIVVLILTYLYKVIYKDEFKPLVSTPKLFMYFGILLFFTAAFPIISFVNKLIVSSQFKGAYSQMLQVANIFLSLGYLLTAICLKREK